jgi:hypothetical protein
MREDVNMAYDTSVLHAAADDIEARTKQAIERHHELHRTAQAALNRVPPRLQALLQAYVRHMHEHCLDAYHNDHLPVSASIHDFAHQLEHAEAQFTPTTRHQPR